jgi:hypothetical protein
VGMWSKHINKNVVVIISRNARNAGNDTIRESSVFMAYIQLLAVSLKWIRRGTLA